MISEGNEVLKDTLMLHNTGSKPVCFRIRVSVPHIFVLKLTEGVLDPAQKLSIPVVLKSFPQNSVDDADAPLAKFAIEFLDCDDDYYIVGPKSFWKANASRAVRSSVQSKAIKSMDDNVTDIEESLEVSPQCLYFNGMLQFHYSALYYSIFIPCTHNRYTEKDDPLQSAIELHNVGKISLVYRIRTSVPNLFVLKNSEGVLESSQKISIPVVLKYFPSTGNVGSGGDLLAKFAVEFLECRDDYYIMGSKEYWQAKSSHVVCKKVESRTTVPKTTADNSITKKVESTPIEDQLEVSPGCLVFRGMFWTRYRRQYTFLTVSYFHCRE